MKIHCSLISYTKPKIIQCLSKLMQIKVTLQDLKECCSNKWYTSYSDSLKASNASVLVNSSLTPRNSISKLFQYENIPFPWIKIPTSFYSSPLNSSISLSTHFLFVFFFDSVSFTKTFLHMLFFLLILHWLVPTNNPKHPRLPFLQECFFLIMCEHQLSLSSFLFSFLPLSLSLFLLPFCFSSLFLIC